jgi:phosphatidylinositol alpha-1,6-mannosyltransferase
MRILVLHPDGFGGRGGIAKFNRDLLTALASYPATECVTALPRQIVEPLGPLPPRLEYRTGAARGKTAFALAVLAELARWRWYDLVICGHVNLLPLLVPLRLRTGAQTGLVIHGVDAWEPVSRPGVRRALRSLDWVFSVSAFTKDRFLAWSGVAPERCFVIPNTVDLRRFTPGPRRDDLVARYGLAGRRVLMSLSRLDPRERYKGIDEVIEAMPKLLAHDPSLAYLVCGSGDDRPRLEAKAGRLGLADRVIFTGYVAEADKVDHYRLADCFLLAGWGEGFGIVLLEAMACGVPVVASSVDGSREAVADGELGVLVDPRQPDALMHGIETALARPRGIVPVGLRRFSYDAFEERVHRMLLAPLARALAARRHGAAEPPADAVFPAPGGVGGSAQGGEGPGGRRGSSEDDGPNP